MKISKIYMLLLAAFTIVACDPLAETFEKMDKNPAPIVAELEFTLDEDDYELSGNENAAKYGSFSNEDDAKEGIPNILVAKYPQLGVTSSAIVYYDLYQGSVKFIYDDWKADLYVPEPVEDPIPVYTVTTADYDAVLGEGNYGNFDNAEDINTLLNMKYPDAYGNTGVELTYEYYSGGTSTVTNKWSKHYDVWYFQNDLDSDAYSYMGRSSYFSSIDDAETKVPVWLTNTQFPYAKAGDRHLINFTYKDYDDNKNYKDRLILNEFDGDQWFVISSITVATLKLGHDGKIWVPDNTIKYTMASADYDWVIANYADINPAGVASMSNYGNYDLTIWSSEEIQNSIADILMNNFASAEDGQKYLVTYSVWTGSAGDFPTLHMVKAGDKYVLVE